MQVLQVFVKEIVVERREAKVYFTDGIDRILSCLNEYAAKIHCPEDVRWSAEARSVMRWEGGGGG